MHQNAGTSPGVSISGKIQLGKSAHQACSPRIVLGISRSAPPDAGYTLMSISLIFHVTTILAGILATGRFYILYQAEKVTNKYLRSQLSKVPIGALQAPQEASVQAPQRERRLDGKLVLNSEELALLSEENPEFIKGIVQFSRSL